MKILQINKYPSLKGGTETVLFKTIDLLKKEGHQVVLFSTDEGEVVYEPTIQINYPQKKDTFRYKLKCLDSFFYNRKAASCLEKLLKKERPDIAHIHLYLNSFSVSILPILKKYKVPIVMTLHEYRQICPSYLLLDRYGTICEKCIDRNYYHCFLTRCAKGSWSESLMLTLEMYFRRLFFKTEKYVDQFICVSQFLLKKHQEFNSKIAHKSEIIYNPITTHSQKKTIRGDYLLYFGRLSKEKGVESLLDVIKELPAVKLKIVGEGNLELKNIADNVEILGFQSGQKLKRLIREAMYTVVPSESLESFGMSCAESLALGTPVIAADIGALSELVRTQVNGFLFLAKDKAQLKNVLEEAVKLSDVQYIELSDAASESMKKFSEKQYISKLLKVYQNVLKERK